MTDKECFDDLLPEFEAISAKDVRYPDMPIDVALNEGGIMLNAAREDAEKLSAVGFDCNNLTRFERVLCALRYCQSELIAQTGVESDAMRLWRQEEPAAYELRSELLSALSYALRDDRVAMRSIKRIREGARTSDLLADLAALVNTARKHLEALRLIKFDMAKLAAAQKKSQELPDIFQKAFMHRGTVEARKMRDRAFTLLRDIMRHVLDAAGYVFRTDRARLEFYHSTYRNRTHSGSGEPPVGEPPVENGVTAGNKSVT